MIDFLLAVPGKLKTISDYLTTNWTTTRAAKIDNLDAAVTTRAPASTALSTATWSGTLAAKLENTIQTSVVASIQNGSHTNSGGATVDTTITAVDLNKSIIINRSINSTGSTSGFVTVSLTSSTNVRTFHAGAASTTLAWTVLELK